jgi:GxxExxY protein
MAILYSEISDKILKSFYGFKNFLPIELDLSFFKKALQIEMFENGVSSELDKNSEIFYKGKSIGQLEIDLIVENKIAIKCVSSSIEILEKELTAMKTFLRMTKFEVGLVLNFGPDGQHKRVLFTNDFKNTNFKDGYKLNLN